MKTTLFTAIAAASTVMCNGYEIDEFVTGEKNQMFFSCGDDIIAVVNDQDIEINSDGETYIDSSDEENPTMNFEFRVSKPMTEDDLPVKRRMI